MEQYTGVFPWNGKTYKLKVAARHGAEAMHECCKLLSRMVGTPINDLKSHFFDVNKKKEYTLTK
jgi:hypothetical protein